MENGETMEQALRREISEELGDKLEITSITPCRVRDDIRVKIYADKPAEEIYMLYLIFHCQRANREITFNEEFQEIAQVQPEALIEMNLNSVTQQTFAEKGLI